MKRVAYAGLASLVIGLTGCSNSGTFVVLDFTGGPAAATSVDCTLTLAGKAASATFSDKGKAISFPIKGSLQIESGAGSMAVSCDARGASGILGSVTGTVDVVRDKTETLTLSFETVGPDMAMGDGAMPVDGGADAGPDMTTPPTVLTVSPTMHDYGTVTTMTTSPAFDFTITNGGNAQTGALSVSVDNPQFTLPMGGTCQGAQLAPGATCVVAVAYQPASATATLGNLHVTYAGLPVADEAIAQLSGMGVVAGSIKWSTSMADFGSEIVGGSGMSQTFTLTNNSTTTTTSAITISLTGTDTTAFSITNDGCTGDTLAAGATCMVTVQFTPDMAGNVAPSLLATATTGGSDTVVLMGDGQVPAALALNPDTSATPHDYGTVDITSTSAPFTVTVSNGGDVQTGTLSYTATGVTIVTGTGGGTCAASGTASISAHGSCTLVLTMTPATYGAHAGSVVFSATPGGTVTTNTTVTGRDYVTIMAAVSAVAGDGTVSDDQNPMQIKDCDVSSGACQGVYARTADFTLTLTETVSSGVFNGWSQSNGAPACNNGETDPTCVITVGAAFTGSATNTATATPPTYTASFDVL